MERKQFEDHRKQFYWFQLHFFLRSHKASRCPKILAFLSELAYSGWETHYKWEVAPRGEVPRPNTKFVVRRPPRGMKQSEAFAAGPVAPKHSAWLPHRAQKESVRTKFMLLDWLRTEKGYKWDGFSNLYRSLVIFDMVSSGLTTKQIADQFQNGRALAGLATYRKKTLYEESQDWISEILRRDYGAQNLERTSQKPGAYLLRDEWHLHDDLQADRIARWRVRSHYKRACHLIALTEKCQFRLVSLLPPVKY